MRYLITISYDGSKYSGWQRLKNGKSIQGEVEKALSKIAKKDIEIKGAGRTDAKVHAYSQKAHFDLDLDISIESLRKAINGALDKYIYIRDCEVVSDEFHARFDVKEKSYIYKLNLGEYDPMLEDYTLQLNNKLNIKEMKKASKYLLGKHDFKSFVSGEKDNTLAEIKRINFLNYGDIVYIQFIGKNFYRYMVRNLVGALLEVGKNNVKSTVIKDMILNNNMPTLPTAYPQGLYLFDIKY